MGMFVVPVWKRLTKAAEDGNEVPDGNADRHREEYPERQEAVEKRELLAGGGSADLALCDGRGGHQQASQHGSERERKRSAFEKAYFEGEQQAFVEPRPIRLHCLVFLEPAECLPQDLGSSDVRRHDDPVVHPLAFAPRRDDSRAAQVGQMPGNLRLRTAKNLHEVADANLLIAHEVQQPEPGVVSERLEEPFACRTELFLPCLHVYALTNIERKTYIRLSRCMRRRLCQSRFWIQ